MPSPFKAESDILVDPNKSNSWIVDSGAVFGIGNPENPGTEDKDDKKANKANKGTHIYTYDELNRMVSSNVAKETYHKAAPATGGGRFSM